MRGMFIAVFLDTGFYLGLCHPKDKHANESGEIFKKLAEGTYGLLYTSNLIINEAVTIIVMRTNSHPKALNLFEKYVWNNNRIASILYITSELENKTWDLFKKINTIDLKYKKPMSFVDISCIILCKQHQIENIVSFDPHFDRFLNRIYD